MAKRPLALVLGCGRPFPDVARAHSGQPGLGTGPFPRWWADRGGEALALGPGEEVPSTKGLRGRGWRGQVTGWNPQARR